MLNIGNTSGLFLRENSFTIFEDFYVLLSDCFPGKGV